MMNTYEQDAFAPPPGILDGVFPAAAPARTVLPVDDKTLAETKPLAQSIRRWRGEPASA